MQRGGRLIESARNLAPWRIVAGEERQGAARNQQGGHHPRLRVAPPGEEQGALQAVADAEGFEQLVAAGRGIVQVPQRIDDAHGAPRHHEDDDHGRDSQDQQRILGDAGQHAVDDDEDRGADDGAGQRAHAAGDDDEDEISRPEDRERGRRRDDHGVDVEQTRREAAESAGDHEDDQLHLADVDAGRPRRLFVVAHCGQREPVAALEQARDHYGREHQQAEARVIHLDLRGVGLDLHAAAGADHLPLVEDRAHRGRDQPACDREIGALQAQQGKGAEEDQQEDDDAADIDLAEDVGLGKVAERDLVAGPQHACDRDGLPDPDADQAFAHRRRQQEGEGRRDDPGDRQRQPDVDAAVVEYDRKREAADADIDLVAEGEQAAVAGQQVPGVTEHGEDEEREHQIGHVALIADQPRDGDGDREQRGEQAAARPAAQQDVEAARDHREKSPCGRTASTKRISM